MIIKVSFFFVCVPKSDRQIEASLTTMRIFSSSLTLGYSTYCITDKSVKLKAISLYCDQDMKALPFGCAIKHNCVVSIGQNAFEVFPNCGSNT